MAKATAAFFVWDPETARTRVFEDGDDVPDHLAVLVGDHVVDGKPEPEADPESEPDGDDNGPDGDGDDNPPAGGGDGDDNGEPTKLTGDALAEAVKAANENGAEIPASLSADEKRAALAAWDEKQAAGE